MEQDKPMIPSSVMVDIPVVDGFKPTPAEVDLLRVLMDADFTITNPTVPEICKRAGVHSTQTYYTAIKKPGFLKTLQMYALDPCKAKMPKLIDLLYKHAENGSWPHLKALLAITGAYTEGATLEVEQVRIITRPGKFIEDETKE